MKQYKIVHKVIKPQERTARLLTSIEDERHYAKENKLEKRFGAELDRLKATLLNLPANKNTLLIVLRTEKELSALQKRMEKAAKNRGKWWSLGLYIIASIKALFYIGVYFRLISQRLLQQHPSIYIASGLFLFLVWIIYFYVLEQSHGQLHATLIKSLQKKYPRHPWKLLSICLFNLVSFSPLMTAVQLFPQFINPSWDVFLVNVFHLILDIFTSNMITAVVNGLALLPLAGWLLNKFKRTGETNP